jgi:hypothetical protein
MKDADVIEIGKIRFAHKILEKGFRRCSVCKDIKPITEFKKNKSQYKGISNNCYNCSRKLHNDFYVRQKDEIGISFIQEYGKKKGINVFDKEILQQLKNEIIENRKPKYFLDGEEFVTIADFARYINKKYAYPITMTENRIMEGKTTEECRLTEREMRSISHTQGKVKVVDTVTGETFEFNNTADEKLNKMFSKSAITKGIKTGEKTRITTLSKYKNPCVIARILKSS